LDHIWAVTTTPVAKGEKKKTKQRRKKRRTETAQKKREERGRSQNKSCGREEKTFVPISGKH